MTNIRQCYTTDWIVVWDEDGDEKPFPFDHYDEWEEQDYAREPLNDLIHSFTQNYEFLFYRYEFVALPESISRFRVYHQECPSHVVLNDEVGDGICIGMFRKKDIYLKPFMIEEDDE